MQFYSSFAHQPSRPYFYAGNPAANHYGQYQQPQHSYGHGGHYGGGGGYHAYGSHGLGQTNPFQIYSTPQHHRFHPIFEHADGQVAKLDANGDGGVDKAELFTLPEVVFDTYDLNKDGSLQSLEIAKAKTLAHQYFGGNLQQLNQAIWLNPVNAGQIYQNLTNNLNLQYGIDQAYDMHLMQRDSQSGIVIDGSFGALDPGASASNYATNAIQNYELFLRLQPNSQASAKFSPDTLESNASNYLEASYAVSEIDFNRLDKDQSGFIDTEAELRGLSHIDLNEDGKVDIHELNRDTLLKDANRDGVTTVAEHLQNKSSASYRPDQYKASLAGVEQEVLQGSSFTSLEAFHTALKDGTLPAPVVAAPTATTEPGSLAAGIQPADGVQIDGAQIDAIQGIDSVLDAIDDSVEKVVDAPVQLGTGADLNGA